MNVKKLILPLLLLFMPLSIGAVSVSDDARMVALDEHVLLLEDSDGSLTIEDVTRPDMVFSEKVSEKPSRGFTKSVFWARFRLSNNTGSCVEWFLESAYPLHDSIVLWQQDEDGAVQKIASVGDTQPFHARPVNHRHFVFKIRQLAGETCTYYMRFQSTSAMNIFLKLWESQEFLQKDSARQVFIGILFGAIAVMLLYNLFLYISIRDSSYIYYVLFYGFYLLYQLSLSGLAYQFLWPSFPLWHSYSITVFASGAVFFNILFGRNFLSIRRKIPSMDTLLRWVQYFSLIIVPVHLFIGYTPAIIVAMGLALFTGLLLTGSAVRLFKEGYRPARFYLIAWSAFWVGTIFFTFKYFSLVPFNVFTNWGQLSASVFEVTLISLGLADRINFMKRQLESLNSSLESMVLERTGKLHSTLEYMRKREKVIDLELHQAGAIQQGILPPLPTYIEGIRIVASYQAMGLVGGDFYDVYRLNGGYRGIVIADVSGHGMPAALITAMAKFSFTEATQRHLFPADILSVVNRDLVETIKTDDFVTAFFFVIGPNFEVFYGNAAHPHPLVLRSATGEVEEWDTVGLFMGAMEEASGQYQDGMDILDYGDRVLLYTDGVSEAKNGDGENFAEERLKRLLVDSADMPLEEAKDFILKQWSLFRAGSDLADDVTLMLVEIDPEYRKLVQYREKGFEHLGRGELTEAIDQFNQALEINDRDEKTHLYIGECFLLQNEYAEAIVHLEEYLGNNEVDAKVWYHLALAYLRLGFHERAWKSSQKALQLRDGYVDAIHVAIEALETMGRIDEAARMRSMLEDAE